MSKFALGIDVGGTKVAIATVGEDLSVHQKQEVMTHADNGEKLWENIEEVISDFLKTESGSLLGIGVASAGPLDIPQGTLSPVNIPIWRDFPIISRLKKMSNGSKVALHGDALALAHAEHKIGAGRGLENMLGMVVSTGIGGGLILDGKVFPGETGNSCYIGHHSINFEGRMCACGRKGCVEAYASGPQMVAIAHENGWAPQLNSFIDLAQSAREGNEIAIDAISQGTRALSVGIVNFVGTLDINHVVIGGGVAQAGEIFWGPLQKHIETESKAIGFLKNIQLRKAELERDAGILGAALAVLSQGSMELEKSERPWGRYEVLQESAAHKVKCIWVLPGKRLSYQRHQKRAEHWFIVQGTALVTIDGEDRTLGPGATVDFPIGTLHRIANAGSDEVIFVEVQTGTYFGEDDIERVEDDFGR